jgi:hypothetical protein
MFITKKFFAAHTSGRIIAKSRVIGNLSMIISAAGKTANRGKPVQSGRASFV